MPRRSFRSTLTIWNVAIMVLMLIASSLALAFGSRVSLMRDIDRDLAERARDAARPRPGPPGDQPFGPGPPGGEPPPPPPDQGNPDNLRNPRRFDLDGESLGRQQVAAFDKPSIQKALAGSSFYSNAIYEGLPLRIFTRPMVDQGRIVGAVQVARDLATVQELMQVQTTTLLVFIPLAVLVGVIAAMFLTSRALRPIRQLQSTASEITANRLDQRLEVSGDDELASLAAAFNGMLERLDSAFYDLRTAYEHQRRFTADASHELRTPLARIRLATSGALEPNTDSAQMAQALSVSSQAATEMSKLVEQLLTLAKADAGHLQMQLESVDVRVLLAEVVDEQMESDRRCPITLEVPEFSLPANVDTDQLKRAVRNLLQNAVRHSEPGQSVTVGAQGGSDLLIQVKDCGEGIAPEHLSHLGERFYRVDTARSSGRGTGLGLAIVRAIAEAHGGVLQIESTPNQGTIASIRIPSLVH